MSDVEMNVYEDADSRDIDPHTYMGVRTAGPTKTSARRKAEDVATLSFSRRTVYILFFAGILIGTVTSVVTGLVVYHVVINSIPPVSPGRDTPSTNVSADLNQRLGSVVQAMEDKLDSSDKMQLNERMDTIIQNRSQILDSLINTNRKLDEMVKKLNSPVRAWSSWTSWGRCTVTCNGGLQVRTRTCTDPVATNSIRDCRGNDVDKQLCNTNSCPGKKVAFSVYHPYSSLNGDTPTFSKTIVNTGSYNSGTGKFTSPADGIYSFSFTLQHDATDEDATDCWYRVNGVKKTYVSAYHDAYDQVSNTMVVELDRHDYVDLYCEDWGHVFHNAATSFSGVLITPL